LLLLFVALLAGHPPTKFWLIRKFEVFLQQYYLVGNSEFRHNADAQFVAVLWQV
jgi:hypothetical protein